jgi:hypothetical protein
MNPSFVEKTVDEPVQLTTHERDALRARLTQIAVALGHLGRTPKQMAALMRERTEIARKLEQ